MQFHSSSVACNAAAFNSPHITFLGFVFVLDAGIALKITVSELDR